MLDVIVSLALTGLIVLAAGAPLGIWSRPRRRGRHRADRQLLRLIHHTDRKANR
ncbi:hypothetical protein [Streptomyces sp. MK37H]|uniref:hypothetical protein n=1 Tax=Streptomyces sp. MK37H TaxID=2699117 RepID=UPI001B37F632|nr:hypothetical protein [Streptomyces sp. MK37H]MBP8538583.1 hypothetical protein [Streptomyces sp. MK37H]